MSVTPNRSGVVKWPVNPGSEIEAPIQWTMAGPEPEYDGSALLVWVGGFGIDAKHLATAALTLSQASGLWVAGVKLPIKDVASKANNTARGLHDLLEQGVHKVAETLNPGQPPYLAGDSRGGDAVLVAGNTGPCRGIGTLFTMGVASRALGESPLSRGVEIGRRLGRTAWHHGFSPFVRESAMRRIITGGAGEIISIAARGRFLAALDYAFGDKHEELIHTNLTAYRQRALDDRDKGGFAVGLHLTEEDDCFKYVENMTVLTQLGLEDLVIPLKGLHTCIGSVAASSQLESVGGWFKDVHANQLRLAKRHGRPASSAEDA